jgi:hypothetical protein
MADKYERFVAAYLRLNAYFTVPSFIVLAADDPTRISCGQVGNYTETDILAIRMPYSKEVTGSLQIANHGVLTDGSAGKTDVVIAEVKSSNENKPNKAWRAGVPDPSISYVVRFVGLHAEPELAQVAKALSTTFRFENDHCRYRYAVFSKEPNEHYAAKGVTYITFREAIEFIVRERGQCWVEANIGVASLHHQWDDMLIEIFHIANSYERSVEQRADDIETFLAT